MGRGGGGPRATKLRRLNGGCHKPLYEPCMVGKWQFCQKEAPLLSRCEQGGRQGPVVMVQAPLCAPAC